MKQLIYLILFASSTAFSQAQSENFASISGQPFFPGQYQDVVGNPYLFEDWTYSTIVLKDGRTMKGVRSNFNLVTSQFLFLDDKGQPMAASPSVIEIIDVNGRKFIPTSANNTYYEVLSTSGKATLFAHHKKVIMESKAYNSATIQKNFVTTESHLVSVGQNVTEVDSASDLYEILQPADKLKEFAKKEKLKQKSVNSWVKIVDYYNSI